MPRRARITMIGYPHHITQRGNYKQVVFKNARDYERYLSWMQVYSKDNGLEILAYCLMPNHVHFICVPCDEKALSIAFKLSHMRYSSYFNTKSKRVGHLWQGRFYSCVLDENHLYAAVRYVENNPVVDNLVEKPEDWQWSC